MRLNKYIASCGICSRREADKLIESGKVFVNQNQAQRGQEVSEVDTISVNGNILGGTKDKKVIAYYKPKGVTCSERDRHAEKLITDMINYPIRLTYAGRLDKDSEGLILLTNDGDLIEQMMRGSNHHEKEYIVKVNKEITSDFLKKMGEGVFLPELKVKTRPCQISKIGKYTFSIVLTQGLNRQIRRMCKQLQYQVENLLRIRVMNIRIKELKSNQWREIENEELKELYRECGLS